MTATALDNAQETSIIQKIQSYYPEIQAIYLFGSANTAQLRPDSDIDLALLLPVPLAKKCAHLNFSPLHLDLARYLQRDVDLINLRFVSTVLQYQIVNTGKILYCGDKTAYHTFEMLTWSFYQKLNEERSAILQEFLQTGRAYNI